MSEPTRTVAVSKGAEHSGQYRHWDLAAVALRTFFEQEIRITSFFWMSGRSGRFVGR